VLAEERYPGEDFAAAEYDFALRRWGYGDGACAGLTEAQRTHLAAYERETWPDADALIRFCERAGAPDGDSLLTRPARAAYEEALRHVVAAYEEALRRARSTGRRPRWEERPGRAAYDEACLFAWIRLFGEAKNRIQAWK